MKCFYDTCGSNDINSGLTMLTTTFIKMVITTTIIKMENGYNNDYNSNCNNCYNIDERYKNYTTLER